MVRPAGFIPSQGQQQSRHCIGGSSGQMLPDAMNRNHSHISVFACHFCIHRETPLLLQNGYG
jgi:hypothetical protein